MKKFIITGAAISALIAGQALAATPGYTGTTHDFGASTGPSGTDTGEGGDGIAQWYIYGSAASYCVLGQAGAAADDTGTNVTIDTTTQAGPNGTGGNGYNGATSDGSVKIDQLQGPNDRQNAWQARIRLPNSVCNSGYTVTANSANGGLTNSASTSDASFTSNLNYKVKVGFAGTTGSADASDIHNTNTTLVTSPQANAGEFIIEFTSENSGKYLVAGNYADNVLINLTANVGGTSTAQSEE